MISCCCRSFEVTIIVVDGHKEGLVAVVVDDVFEAVAGAIF